MNSEAHTVTASKIGGSLYLTIPAQIRDGIEGGELVNWKEEAPDAYRLDLSQEGTSRTLKVGGSVKVRIPRDVEDLEGERTQWTIRREGKSLLARRVTGAPAEAEEGGLIETAAGLAVIIRGMKGGPKICAPVKSDQERAFLSVLIEAGEWKGRRVDLTQLQIIREAPRQIGSLSGVTMKKIKETISPLI